MRKLGALLARKSFRSIRDKTNYEYYGGSPLLGVDGICIIAHGASTPLAVKNALRVAAESIEQQVNPHIVEEIRRYHETTTSLEPAAAVR
jgi:glycerol-3-phosphate acyltransferase PlsX